jgi:signal transduction histidine kinase
MTSQPPARIRSTYWTLLIACGVVAVGSLSLGGIVAFATYWPGLPAAVAAAAADGSAWAGGVLAAIPRSEPLGQAVLDYACSVLALVVAVILLRSSDRNWVTMLLALALIGSASAFNLQADTAELMVQTVMGLQTTTGQSIVGLPHVLLRGIACAAYILALVLFPTGRWDIVDWTIVGRDGSGRHLAVIAGGAVLGAIGLGVTLLPDVISCVLFFGLLIPLTGLLVLLRRIRQGATSEHRTQARLLFSVLAAVFVTCAMLGIIALLLRYLNEPGQTLLDPTGLLAQASTAPLFWFARLACAAIAGAMLIATQRHRLWTTEQLFSRSLATTLVIVLGGCGYVVTQAAAGRLTGSETAAVATALVALLFLPLYVHVQRLVDRLLYGRRPTPYSVLAGITALSRSTPADTPNLARVAKAIGRGLGARSCRLTVVHPGLQDRIYVWTDGAAAAADEHVVLPIRLGGDHIGAIAVDRTAVAGLHAQRRHLLADIAEHLGVILQVNRLGIELERQLRAALAHAEDIALSRRAAAAEMDSERRTIERNLHDGAQHHLVSLRLALGLVEHDIARGQFGPARDRLDQLTTQIDTAEAVLVETATGVSAIPLSQHGLVAALNADLRGAYPPIVVTVHGIAPDRRFPSKVEAAVYFCCLEAINNARKHAPGAHVTVQVSEVDGALRFTVRDDGPGFTSHSDGTRSDGAGTDTDSVGETGGRGLRNVTARIAAVGGTLSIRSIPGGGTTIEGAVGLRPDAQTTATADTGAPTDVLVTSRQPVLDQVRKVVREARELYDGSAESARLRELQAQLDEPPQVGMVGPARAGNVHRAGALKARSALRVLDAVVRSSPLGGAQAIRLGYQLERISSSAHELTEIDLINELRSGTLPLAGGERQAAEELLGAAGAEPRARLGLPADTDTDAVRHAAEGALAHWQRRTSHPGSTRAVRDTAEVLVQTCEELLAQINTE